MRIAIRFCGALLLVAVSVNGGATETAENSLRNVYFGETHMHTAYSLDAYLGGTRQTPSDAYRAAKGNTVVVNGQPHRMRRALRTWCVFNLDSI